MSVLGRKTLASFSTPADQHQAATWCCFAGAEPMAAFAYQYTWLKCSLHLIISASLHSAYENLWSVSGPDMFSKIGLTLMTFQGQLRAYTGIKGTSQ